MASFRPVYSIICNIFLIKQSLPIGLFNIIIAKRANRLHCQATGLGCLVHWVKKSAQQQRVLALLTMVQKGADSNKALSHRHLDPGDPDFLPSSSSVLGLVSGISEIFIGYLTGDYMIFIPRPFSLRLCKQSNKALY